METKVKFERVSNETFYTLGRCCTAPFSPPVSNYPHSPPQPIHNTKKKGPQYLQRTVSEEIFKAKDSGGLLEGFTFNQDLPKRQTTKTCLNAARNQKKNLTSPRACGDKRLMAQTRLKLFLRRCSTSCVLTNDFLTARSFPHFDNFTQKCQENSQNLKGCLELHMAERE